MRLQNNEDGGEWIQFATLSSGRHLIESIQTTGSSVLLTGGKNNSAVDSKLLLLNEVSFKEQISLLILMSLIGSMMIGL